MTDVPDSEEEQVEDVEEEVISVKTQSVCIKETDIASLAAPLETMETALSQVKIHNTPTIVTNVNNIEPISIRSIKISESEEEEVENVERAGDVHET